MIRFMKHATHQPFIAATGAAALVHSTWALAVLFSGEPPAWDHTSLSSWAKWVYWLVPALLIAFALDVGQIATSAEIRAGERTPSKYVTFVVFSLATYYLQWIYIAHHMPALELGPGVYQEGMAARVVLMTRNAAIWIIPAFLPLSTTMYTLSGEASARVTERATVQAPPAVTIETSAVTGGSSLMIEAPDDTGEHIAECEHCGWTKAYDNEDSAKRGLAAHSRYCPANQPSRINSLVDHNSTN